jgi:copper chaperone
METFKFKTNIKCGGCVAGLTPHLDRIAGVKNWEVALQHPDRILTVEADTDLNENVITAALAQAGFTAVKINSNWR